jgi:Ca2+-binding RTX toxin-like protein
MVTVANSTLSGNSAGIFGGGVYNIAYDLGASAVLTVTNSTLSGNSAGVLGGGVYNTTFDSGASTVELLSSTLSSNAAPSGGGGVFNTTDDLSPGVSTVGLTRSLVSGNTAVIGAEVYTASGTTTIANNYNLFGHSGLSDLQAFSGFAPTGSDLNATSDGINTPLTDILDTTLADHGGPTFTHALADDSPALEAAGMACPPPSTDQRGILRPQGLACDIGAFEMIQDPLCPGLIPTAGCKVNGVPNQLCVGTAGNDTIVGTNGDDVILGLALDDKLDGRRGDDLLCGGAGNDELGGGPGDDRLLGTTGKDTLKGEAGEDFLIGGEGEDTLDGGSGVDGCAAGETLKRCEL